jgi:prepilin-type N-terminal cleavage/methylation domain-containing protein
VNSQRLRNRAGQRKPAGFTLTELLVVIAIIILLTAAAIPALSAFRRGQRLEQAGKQVQSFLNEVRRAAVTKHARHIIVFFSFQEGDSEELFQTRHGMAVYSEPVGRSGFDGYFPGGYPERPTAMILPKGIRFAEQLMQFNVAPASNRALPLPVESAFFRRRNADALTFLSDGTIQSFDDYPAMHPAVGENIYLPDEGYYQVPDTTRADVVLIEVGPDGSEIIKGGMSRRVLVDLNPYTGRSISRFFEVGETFETENVDE